MASQIEISSSLMYRPVVLGQHGCGLFRRQAAPAWLAQMFQKLLP